MVDKVRLDVLLAERHLAPSREVARRLIMAGEVRIDGEIRDKPGMRVPRDAAVQVQPARRFVSRGGDKLAGALAAFPVTVEGRVCADVGASTGGFTDCLLRAGAARVYAIDVGYGQLDYRLRIDPRVVVMERTNARYVTALDEPVSLIVVDASFISLKLLLPVLRGWTTPAAEVITLVKPQFEAGKGQVGKGGVVRDPAVHERVLRDVLDDAVADGFTPRGLIVSPLKGPAGNIEFLAWLTLGQDAETALLDNLVAGAMDAAQAGDVEDVRSESPTPDD
ncbi:TlyA family RNA methyltransferase [Aggregatilinea lenta]|uniref:TlyA family RNA methyltransferase n=1 Tax=Aggregatilinea lenta TaxID=913108 RepID=UPI000E5AB164|nr:TlyA family RNA methyltransferase [Aggregatilinea lenta]